MDLVLEFQRGVMSGEGYDGIGGFVVTGTYSTNTQECSWKKTYIGRHTVEYRGFGEGEDIWGTWTLPGARGGFRIWPLSEGAPLREVTEEEPVTQTVGEPSSLEAKINGVKSQELLTCLRTNMYTPRGRTVAVRRNPSNHYLVLIRK